MAILQSALWVRELLPLTISLFRTTRENRTIPTSAFIKLYATDSDSVAT